MNILEKNFITYPKLKEYYFQYKDSLYVTETARSNDVTLKINNIYIHSKYDPVKEAARIVDMLLIDKELLDVIILFGSGLGYAARMLFERILKNNDQKILPYLIYIEKDLKLFLTSLQYFDWSEIMNHKNFKIFLDTDKESIGSFIQSIPTKRLRFYYHRPSYIMNQEYYKNVQNYISYVLDRKDMNTATFCNFQKLWTKNFIYNIPKVLKSKPVKQLKNTGLKTTSVVIAAGPTLDKSIEYLQSIKDSAVIIAVDTVYKHLIKHSIKPDVIVTIDPQYWNYKYLEDVNVDDTIIVTNSNVYPKIFDISPVGNYFTGSSIFPIVKYFEDHNETRGSLSAGGSVSTTAFDTARIIGSDNIIIIGLDLSFPGRMTHFKGAFFETNFLNNSDYFHTTEHASYNYLAHVDMQVIDSTNSSKVYSDQKMYLFKKWFDREIPLTKANVYLPDLGGALLEGCKIMKFEKFPEPDIQAKKQFLYNKNILINRENPINPDTALKKAKLIIKESGEIKKICKKIISYIPEDGNIKESDHEKINQLEQALLSTCDRKEAVSIISSSAQDILLSIMENIEYGENEKSSAWIKTRVLYNSILDLSDFYKKTLDKLLKIF